MGLGVNWRAVIPTCGGYSWYGGDELPLAGGSGQKESSISRLVQYLGTRRGEVSGEEFKKLLDSLEAFLKSLLEGENARDAQEAVAAMENLLHVRKLVGDDFVQKMVKIMKSIIQTAHKRNSDVVHCVATGFGRIVASGDPVEEQVRWAVRFLEEQGPPKYPSERLGTIMVLKSLAENAPASCNVHVNSFLNHIWKGLIGEDPQLRILSSEALRACLRMFETRETRNQVLWYHRLAANAVQGLAAPRNPPWHMHGCVLTLSELLSSSGEFMLARYSLVSTHALALLKHDEYQSASALSAVRIAVLSLIPKLAEFLPERFIEEDGDKSIKYMTEALIVTNNWELTIDERNKVFYLLSEVITVLHKHQRLDLVVNWEREIGNIISSAILARANGEESPYQGALKCCGVLAETLGSGWVQQAKSLLVPMAGTGVSDELTEAMVKIGDAIPELRPDIRRHTLKAVESALADAPSPHGAAKQAKTEAKNQRGDCESHAQKLSALKVLETFDWGKDSNLLEMVQRLVVPLLKSGPDVSLRRAAAKACAAFASLHLEEGGSLERGDAQLVTHALLEAGVTDANEEVRVTIMRLLHDQPALSKVLSQPSFMLYLFTGFGDGCWEVVKLSIQLVGALGSAKPGDEVARPMLETLLDQLLMQMEICTGDAFREECARKLGLLVQWAPYVILPNTDRVAKQIISLLRSELPQDGNFTQVQNQANFKGSRAATVHGVDAVVTAILETLGHLAETATSQLEEKGYMPGILELTVQVLRQKCGQDMPDEAGEAVRTLCKIVESTGDVIKPYEDFPWLLPELLKMLEVENVTTRKLIVKVLGTICALDPAQYRLIQAKASGEGQLEREGVRPVQRGESISPSCIDRYKNCLGVDGRSLDSFSMEVPPVSGCSANSEESYSITAMNTLLRVLRAPAHSEYHRKAVGTLAKITKSLSIGSVPFLQTLVPNWCSAIYTGDSELKVYILEQFIDIVVVAKQHIRKFLDRIMQMLCQLLSADDCPKKILVVILRLIGRLAGVCQWSFLKYLDWLVPRFLLVLDTGEDDVVVAALPALEALGFSSKSQFHQILPAMCKLLWRSDNLLLPGKLKTKRAVLKAIRVLIRQVHAAETVAVMVRPLLSLIKHASLQSDVVDTLAAIVMTLEADSYMVSYIRLALAQAGIEDERIDKVQDHQRKIETLSSVDWEKGAEWRNEFEPELPALVEDSGVGGTPKLQLDEILLLAAWDTSQACTSEDWSLWMRSLSLLQLEISPSPAIRECFEFVHKIPSLWKDLFPASFISCWSELSSEGQQKLIRSLEAALASPRIPNEIITTLLNLAECMEHDNLKMPLDTRTLAALALKCQALAKALHYKELEFQENPTDEVGAIIAINNQLRQPEAADGMLKYAKKELGLEVKESWYEKLHKWDRALHQYKVRASRTKAGTLDNINANMGCIRCYFALWDWDSLSKLCQKEWGVSDPIFRKEIGPLAAEASWHMGQWHEMSEYLTKPNSSKDTPDATRTAFLNAVHAIHSKRFDFAEEMIDEARGHLSVDLAVLAGESYDRAYEAMVMSQQLTGLEEVVQYSLAKNQGREDRIAHIQSIWRKRLQGVQQQAEVWQGLLSVQYLAQQHHEDKGMWVKFASMCRQQNREHHARNTLQILLGYDPMTRKKGEIGYGAGSGQPEVMYAFLKHMYCVTSLEIRPEIYDRMKDLVHGELEGDGNENTAAAQVVVGSGPLISKAYVRLGKWMQHQEEQTEEVQKAIMDIMENATIHAGSWAKAWREWALFHLKMMGKYENKNEASAMQHVAPAVRGFFKALQLSQDHALNGGMGGNGPSKDTYQDILRLLTLWFQHGNAPHVCEELEKGFNMVRVETWLVVLPQINARIHIKYSNIQRLIHMLLKRIGQAHPQALLYPLLVGSHSNSIERKHATEKVLHSMEVFAPRLVEEAKLLTQQLVEIAVLLDERWHEALEEASRLYFAEAAPRLMLEVMLPLHNKLRDEPARTTIEKNFKAQHGDQLDDAHGMLRKYETTNQETSTQLAWDNYYHVFRKINRDLANMTMLHLADVAPELLDREFMCAVPGTYAPFEDKQVCIQRIVPEIQVIKSKQRPRKLTIEGSDGNDYVFLLKGHEDLRQDERVMQLFGLVNTLMASDYKACERELSIARYAVIPLSPNVGLIGWVPNCDTMHQLIRDYRESMNTAINLEHQLMKSFAPNYDNLQLIQKIEVFEHALDSTEGDDLRKVMWIKSRTSESWLAHRTCYIRSCAVMSIVGYILGLGDRHPSNLMIDRYTGKLLHIDFGDCFESGMKRDKFPEKVPFRLTRMMVKAMEVSGVEGTFRQTCELVMRVLRIEKDRVMAMLEAFIYDPLINWRLVKDAVGGKTGGQEQGHEQEQGQVRSPISLHLQESESEPVPHPALGPLGAATEEGDGLDVEMGQESFELRKIRSEQDSTHGEMLADSPEAASHDGGAHEMLNNRAIEVTTRIKSKLSGREFSAWESVSVEEQVDRLIVEARSHANLCQAYIGWCPFW